MSRVDSFKLIQPSLQKMKDEGVPPNVVYLKLYFWNLLPDARMTRGGEYDQETVDFLNAIGPIFDKVKTVDDFREFLDEAYALALGEENRDEFRETIRGYLLDGSLVRKTMVRCHRFLGLALPNFMIPENFEMLVKQSRHFTGENMQDIAREDAQKWEAERKESEKRRRKEQKKLVAALSGEEYVEEEETLDEKEEKPAVLSESVDVTEGMTDEQKARHERREKRRIWGEVEKMWKDLEKEANPAPLTDEEETEMESRLADFAQKYGLASLRFARNIGKAEREKALVDMEKNFSNIAGALEMPTENIGFRGALHVFFGGEMPGTGGAYTPDDSTLYISRSMGAQVITHEWFHGLDFYLGRQSGILGTALSHMDHSRRPTSSYVAPTYFAMGDLMDFIRGDIEEDNVPVDAQEYQRIFAEWMNDLYGPELVRVSREERKSNDVKRTLMLLNSMHSEDVSPVQFGMEFTRMYAARVAESEPEESYLQSDMVTELQAASDTYMQSRRAGFRKDDKKSFLLFFAEQMNKYIGREYFSLPTEMMARLGEQYVFEKMGVDYPGHRSGQHACGKEKETLQKYFGAWVETAKDYLASPVADRKNVRKSMLAP